MLRFDFLLDARQGRAFSFERRTQRVVHDHQVEQGGPAAVTGSVALAAADRPADVFRAQVLAFEIFLELRRKFHRLLAAAKLADQPLRDDQLQRGRHAAQRDAEIHQPVDRAEVVVAVDGRNDEVAGLRRVGRHLRGLLVADLAEADDVRILPQRVAQQLCERDVGLGVDLHLADVLHYMFDRIFDRDHVFHRIVDRLQHRVERRGFAAAGRSAHEDHAGRHADRALHDLQVFAGDAGVLQRHRSGGGGEHTDRDLLPAECADARHAERSRPARTDAAESAVLRTPLFGDVHAGSDLDRADRARAERRIHLLDDAESAVDAVTHHDRAVRLRVEKDIACALAERFEDQHLRPVDRLAGLSAVVRVERRLAAGIEQLDVDLPPLSAGFREKAAQLGTQLAERVGEGEEQQHQRPGEQRRGIQPAAAAGRRIFPPVHIEQRIDA